MVLGPFVDLTGFQRFWFLLLECNGLVFSLHRARCSEITFKNMQFKLAQYNAIGFPTLLIIVWVLGGQPVGLSPVRGE